MALYDPQTAPETKPAVDLTVFERAARMIEEHGWCQNKLNTCDGRVCALGAYEDSIGHPNYKEMWQSFAQGMGFANPCGLVAWNDAEGRDAAEVIDRLRRASRGEWA